METTRPREEILDTLWHVANRRGVVGKVALITWCEAWIDQRYGEQGYGVDNRYGVASEAIAAYREATR